MPFGGFVGDTFFVMLMLAAWSSSVGLLVPPVERLQVRHGVSRAHSTYIVGMAAWLIGILCALSFSSLADFKPLGGMTIYRFLDYLTSSILMPVTGVLVAIFAGWMVSERTSAEELQLGKRVMFDIWRFLVRFIVPITIVIVLITSVI